MGEPATAIAESVGVCTQTVSQWAEDGRSAVIGFLIAGWRSLNRQPTAEPVPETEPQVDLWKLVERLRRKFHSPRQICSELNITLDEFKVARAEARRIESEEFARRVAARAETSRWAVRNKSLRKVHRQVPAELELADVA